MKLFVGISVKLHSGSQSSVCSAGVYQQGRYLHSGTNGHSPHFQEDLPELRSHLHQWVQVAAFGRHAQGVKVVRLELLLFPTSTEISTELRVRGHKQHEDFFLTANENLVLCKATEDSTKEKLALHGACGNIDN